MQQHTHNTCCDPIQIKEDPVNRGSYDTALVLANLLPEPAITRLTPCPGDYK